MPAFVSGHYALDQDQQALEDVAAQHVVKALIIPHRHANVYDTLNADRAI